MQKRALHLILTVLVFTYIVFEELVWESIAKPIYDYIHSLKLSQKIEEKIQHLHPWILLILFLGLFIKVELLGLFAGYMLVKGYILSATLLYATKIPIAAFAFWLFHISKNKLLSIGWFKRAYTFTMQKIEWLKSTEIYRNIKTKSTAIKQKIKHYKAIYFPKGELKKRARRIYIQLKKIFKKEHM